MVRYFEETIYVTPSRESSGVAARSSFAPPKAADPGAGPHARAGARRDAGERSAVCGCWRWRRRPIGGLCARVLPGLEELILRHAAGEDVCDRFRCRATPAAVMMIPDPDAEGIYVNIQAAWRHARALAGVEDVDHHRQSKAKSWCRCRKETVIWASFLRGATSPAEAVNAALRERVRAD